MGMSESHDSEAGDPVHAGHDTTERITLASLRSQFTSTDTPTLDEAMGTRARFRQEERLRADLRRERRLRQQAITERVNAMKANIAKDLAVQHELTLDALENELRGTMEAELETMERDALAAEEARARHELDLRLERQVQALHEKHGVEQHQRLEERKAEMKAAIETQLHEEYDRRLAIQKERLRLDYNQTLQQRLRDIESNLEQEMERRFVEMEGLEINRLEEGHEALLAEREEQLRRGIRTRLEQQLRQRLKQREARLKVEYERRSLRLEEDIAQQLQSDIEQQLRRETDDLEERMREDVELAIAKRRDELRSQIESQLNEQQAGRLAERKARLKAKYDLTFNKAIDDISRSLQTEIEAELEHRKENEFASYRHAREAEIQNRLSRYRYEREAELREQLEAQYTANKQDWTERLDLEFQSREAAARKAIMSEVDAQLRNERLTHETDLDLLKEETALELEVEMEERLQAFKNRKENEVATQLERQLDKREEIMRNKALIDVRKREAQIRAEIEAQLGLKRAEIRDRLKGLAEKMDSFKEMAEEKMREAVSQQIQGEIDADEGELRSREQEFSALQATDTRAEKRQKWMQSISGQAPAAFGAGAMDPTALGARPDGLGAAAGRPLRGLMGQQAQDEPRLGLGNMRAPMTSARPLAGQVPPVRTVRQPIAQPVAQPEPVRSIRQPISKPALVPQEEAAMEDMGEAMLEETTEPAEVVQEVVETTEATVEPAVDELVEEGSEEDRSVMTRPTALLKPIRGTLQPLTEEEEVRTASLTPVGHMLVPEKKRGPPPSASIGRPETAKLRPVQGTLTPVSKKPVKQLKADEEQED